MRRTSTLSLGFLVLLGALAPAAHADKASPLKGAPALRHRLELRKGRFEITPQFMMSMNQDFRHFIGGGVKLTYHINDWIGIGLQAAGGGGIDTSLTGTINNKLVSESDPTAANRPFLQPTQEQFKAHLGTINMVASLYAQLTPMSGKLAIFGAGFLRYDLYLMAGFGLMNITNGWGSYQPNSANLNNATKQTCDKPNPSPDNTSGPNFCDPLNAGIKPSFMWGLGIHLFFNEWFGLNLELRDFVASTNMGGLDLNGDYALNSNDSTVTNNFFGSFGVVIMLPIKAKVSP
jgi:outer membrane beta-barrel protein